MSSTRHATDGRFHQEAFCSAVEFETGLLGNLVAKKCQTVSDPAHRELIWFLQAESHRQGLRALAEQLLKLDPADEAPIPKKDYPQCRGLNEPYDWIAVAEQMDASSQALEKTPDQLELTLSAIATDPGRNLQSPLSQWCLEVLGRYMLKRSNEVGSAQVKTTVTEMICAELEYVQESGVMVLLQGPAAKVGKSFAAQVWCERRPGQTRYVQVPASSDDISFFRAMSKALGLASALSMKGVQMRERVEITLQSSRLMVVFDDAHYLWPQSNRREALPNRLNWILSALVRHGVPVALLTTPQFVRDQKIVTAKTGWTGAQFCSGIGEWKRLPDKLTAAELRRIAQSLLPEADDACLQDLVTCAYSTERFLAALLDAVRRARFIAAKADRPVRSCDIKEAVYNHVIPSNNAILKAFGGEAPTADKARCNIAPRSTNGDTGSNRLTAKVPVLTS